MILLILFLISPAAYSQLDLSFVIKTAPTFGPQDLIINGAQYSPRLPEKKVLLSPVILKIPNINLVPVAQVHFSKTATQIASAPEVPPLLKIKEPIINKIDTGIENIIQISPDEYKMIQALIFFEIQKKYDLALSLFIGLIESPTYKSQALLHYADSAQALGLSSEYREKILRLLEKAPNKTLKIKDLLNAAVTSAVKNVAAFQTADMSLLNSLVESFNLDVSKNSTYLYKLAQYLITQNSLFAAESALNQISSKSEIYASSVLLSASLKYRQGQVSDAINQLEKIIPLVEKNKKNPVRNLLIATLARIYFQKAQYKQAYQTYLKIDRSSPLWLPSVIEQAWAQILVGDHIGAAGNMFSLHTEIFKKAYLPESYIVRSVGYLNLCQYGDALHVLTDLDSRFKRTYEKLVKFQSENISAPPYYDLVKTWYTQNKSSEINSLPASFVAELAVHPSFTTYQKQINQHEVEITKFSQIITEFSNKEGLDNMKKMRQAAWNRAENSKAVLRSKAAAAIRARYDEFTSSLAKLLEQEEILAYEIYSGAGEHIRYQMAGGKIEDRDPATLTPEEKKSYKWKFRGEVWEDEIGHYRSSLKNVCANESVAKSKGDQ